MGGPFCFWALAFVLALLLSGSADAVVCVSGRCQSGYGVCVYSTGSDLKSSRYAGYFDDAGIPQGTGVLTISVAFEGEWVYSGDWHHGSLLAHNGGFVVMKVAVSSLNAEELPWPQRRKDLWKEREEKEREHQAVCDDIHGQEPLYTGQTTIKALVPQHECESIISEADAVADKVGWTKKRHDAYPTTVLIIQDRQSRDSSMYFVVYFELSSSSSFLS